MLLARGRPLLVSAAPFCRGGPSSSTTERCTTQRDFNTLITCEEISLSNIWDVSSSVYEIALSVRGGGGEGNV